MRLKDAKIGFLGGNIRVFQTLFLGSYGIPGAALTLNRGYKHSGYCPRHSTFQVGYPRSNSAKYTQINTKHGTDKHNIVKIRA